MKSDNEYRKTRTLGVLFFVIVAIPFCLNFWSLKGLSKSSSTDWENFGSYVGGIVGPIMTFLTLIYLMKSNSEQNASAKGIQKNSRQQRNLDNLFELINGFRSITYNLRMESKHSAQSGNSRVVTGNEVFLHLYLKFRDNYILQIRANLMNCPEKFKFQLPDNARRYVDQFYRSPNGFTSPPAAAVTAPFPECLEIMKATPNGGYEIPTNYEDVFVKMFYDEIIKLITPVDDKQFIDAAFKNLYESDGYLFGHYFRNFSYILDYIEQNEFEDKEFCFKYLRSILSSYENVLLYYDCIYYSNSEMVEIIDRQEILNDLNKQEFIHKHVIKKSIYEKPKATT